MAICTNCGHDSGWHGEDSPYGQPPRANSHRTCCWSGHPGGCRCPKLSHVPVPGAFNDQTMAYANEKSEPAANG